MTLQSSGSITARDIAIELGYTQGAETKIGDYRLNGGQDFGGVKLPVSEGVPTSGEIKFSDFYDARRTLVVDYHSGSPENFPENAKDRFTSRSKVVVGGFVGNDNDTSGKKVVIVVNKDISSAKGSVNNCALKTGTGWSSDTVLEVLLGSNGELLGAGGDGGNGGNPSLAGGSGASGFGSGRIEGSPRHSGGGGSGGSAGAAIRRNVGFTVVIQNLGPPSQLVGDTSATGIA